MKKTYSKPEILFEDFSLSTSITAGCRFITKLATEGVCGYKGERSNQVVFTSDVVGCEYTEQDGDTLCYHVPNADNDIFNS